LLAYPKLDRLAKLIGACWIGLGIAYHVVLGARAGKPLQLES
jgi:hypothetical protein